MHQKIEEELHGLPENFIILTLVEPHNSEKANMAILDYLMNKQGYKGNYVAVSRSYKNIYDVLKSNSLDPENLFFIDCVSKDIGEKREAQNCIYIDSPQHLTDLSIAIQELMNAKYGEFLIIDSINTLLIYNDTERLMRFMHFISNRIRMHELKGVMISLSKGTDAAFLAQISQFCDKVLDFTDFI